MSNMIAPPPPDDKLLRASDVCRWLGVHRSIIKKWVDCEVIHRIHPVANGYAFYDRDEIASKILNGNGTK